MSFFKKLLSPLLRTNVGEGRGGFGGATLPRTAPTREPTEYDEIADAEATTAEAEAAGILSGLDAEESRLMAGEWIDTPQSSNVKGFRFLAGQDACEFEFQDGSFYRVDQFTASEAVAFLHSESKGRKYWDMVRVRGDKYATRKPYVHMSGPSRTQRQWNATDASAAAHAAKVDRASPFAKGGLGRKRGKRK